MTNQVNQAFEEWLKENYPDYPPPLSEVWQAATKASEQRIQELEYLIDLDTEIHENSSKTILELQAHVNQLREALERLDGWLEVRHLGGLMPNEKELLKTTTAQSLAERKEEYKCKLMSECTDPNL